MKRLYRSKDALVGGVCAGVADYIGIDKTVVRVVYLFATLGTGLFLGGIAYAACMFIIPEEDENIIDG